MGEEGRQKGPSDTCHSQFGLWTSVAGRVAAQRHSAPVFGGLSRMGDHSPGADLQDLGEEREGGIGETLLRWEGHREGRKEKTAW